MPADHYDCVVLGRGYLGEFNNAAIKIGELLLNGTFDRAGIDAKKGSKQSAAGIKTLVRHCVSNVIEFYFMLTQALILKTNMLYSIENLLLPVYRYVLIKVRIAGC
jgi:hypothetical protein